MFHLMMIVGQPDIARYVAACGVDRIFVDLEVIGKKARQGHLDTWLSAHTFEDISRVRDAVPDTQLVVRLNPLHENSPMEVEEATCRGADFLMLPMFHSSEELGRFCTIVAGRIPVIPLVETPGAFEQMEKVANVPGVGEVFIGLNDLHLAYGMKFMFEPLANGMLDTAAGALRQAGKSFGFGGIARVGEGQLPAERILGEHVRLGSSSVILSRTFHRRAVNLESMHQEMDFALEVSKLREAYGRYTEAAPSALLDNQQEVKRIVRQISGAL